MLPEDAQFKPPEVPSITVPWLPSVRVVYRLVATCALEADNRRDVITERKIALYNIRVLG